MSLGVICRYFIYKDYKYSNSLIKLGKVESELDVTTKQNGYFSVKIEKVN